MKESLSTKALSGIIWSTVERFSVQGIQFVLTIIIARLVTPSDYGLVAMVGVFLAIAQTFIDSGFSNALIQKRNRTQIDYSTVFYFNIFIGVFTYLVLYTVSPYISDFYREPKLDLIAKVIGLNLVVNSFSVVQRAKLTIELNFRLQAIMALVAVIVSGIGGIYWASIGYGVWAIVYQTLLNNILNTLFLWAFSRWLPSLVFSWQSFYGLFKYGSKLLIAGLLNTVYLNLYSLVIGRRFSAMSLGYYNRTSTIAQFFSVNLSNTINRALFPVLCEVQNDNDRLLRAYEKSLQIVSYCIFPLMTILLCLSKPLIIVFLGQKWLPCSNILQILCLAYCGTPIMILMFQLLNVKGKSNYTLKAEIYKKAFSLCLLFVTMPFGVEAMCWGILVYSVGDFFIMIFFMKQVFVNITIKKHLFILRPILIICLSIGGIIFLILSLVENPLIQIFLSIMIAVVCLISFSVIFKIEAYTLVKEIVFKYLNK